MGETPFGTLLPSSTPPSSVCSVCSVAGSAQGRVRDEHRAENRNQEQRVDDQADDERDQAHDDRPAGVRVVEDFAHGDDADHQAPERDEQRNERPEERDDREEIQGARRGGEPDRPERLVEVRFRRGLRHQLRADEEHEQGEQGIPDERSDKPNHARDDSAAEDIADERGHAGDHDDRHRLRKGVWIGFDLAEGLHVGLRRSHHASRQIRHAPSMAGQCTPTGLAFGIRHLAFDNADMARTEAPETWGHSTVRTACPLDCPDACSLDVTVENGRIRKIDGGTDNPVTRDFICAKVRRFEQRVYGEDRLLYPAVRQGGKGQGTFARVTWDEALDLIARRMTHIKAQDGAEAILPFYYGGSNGLLTQNTNDAELWRRFGTSRLDTTVCAAATGAANLGLYGKMPGVVYQDYPHATLIVLWGVNPSASGIHLIPYIKQAQANGATLAVIDPRATSLAKKADLHLAIRPGTDLPVALALHRVLFEDGHADDAFLAAHTRGADSLRAAAAPWTIEKAAAEAGIDPASLRRLAELYVS